MLKRFLILRIAGTVILMFAGVAAEKPLGFRLNLTPGESYVCAMDMSQRVTQTIEGEEQVMEQNNLVVWNYNILSNDNDGNIEIMAKYSRIKSSQKFGFQTVEFDSDDPPDYVDQSTAGLKALVGSELNLRLSASGKVQSIDGFEEMIDKIVKELNIPDTPQKAEAMTNLRKQFGEEALRQSFEQMTAFYADKPVDIGEVWHNDISIESGFPMVIESDFTLVSRENSISEINIVSKLKSDPGSNGIDMGLFTLFYTIDGEQNGVITMDEASGLPIKSDIRQSFSGTVTVKNAQDIEEQSWPISAEGRIVITFEKQ